MIEGSNWLLKVIFGGCIFWVFQQKLGLFDKFRKEIVNSFKYPFLTTFWVQKSFFYIFRSIFSKKIVKFRVGTRILKNLGTIDHSTINLHNHKRNVKTMAIYNSMKLHPKTSIRFLPTSFRMLAKIVHLRFRSTKHL